MTTPSRRTPVSKARRAASPPSAQPAPDSKPFLRFHHSEALRKKTPAVIARMGGPQLLSVCGSIRQLMR